MFIPPGNTEKRWECGLAVSPPREAASFPSEGILRHLRVPQGRVADDLGRTGSQCGGSGHSPGNQEEWIHWLPCLSRAQLLLSVKFTARV